LDAIFAPQGVVIASEFTIVEAGSPRRPMVAVAGRLRPGERVVLMPMGLAAGETVRPHLAEAMDPQP